MLGSRLYKETPHRLISKTVKASQVKKGRVGETAWELQASTVEELQALGEKVRRSRDRNDQKLATEVRIGYGKSSAKGLLSNKFEVKFSM